MLGSVWNFIKRHRRKFIFTGAVIGGSVFLLRYVRRKLEDWQNKEASECFIQARAKFPFNSVKPPLVDGYSEQCYVAMQIAGFVIPVLPQNLIFVLFLLLTPTNRVEIWENLKILSFTRTMAAVYVVCMLLVTVRIQLNILGGYIYLDSLLDKNSQCRQTLLAPSEVQQSYLANIQYLIGQGLTDLVLQVKHAVTKSMNHMPLKQRLSLNAMQDLLNSVRQQMEYRRHNGYHDGSATSLAQFMLPPDLEQVSCMNREEVILNKLMAETRDVLESRDFHSILTTLLDAGFARLMDQMAEPFQSTYQENSTVFSANQMMVPLAKIIPVMSGLLNTVCADAPNSFVQDLLQKEQVKDFAANVYEAFSQPEPQPVPP